MEFADLEQLIDRELKAMRAPDAPSSLVPNVMRAVETSSARWYSRGWLAWPRPAQAASLAFVILAAIAFFRESGALWAWVTSSASVTTPAWLSGLGDAFTRVLTVARVPWHMLEPVVSYFALLALAASLAMTASWFAFTRLISGGVPTR